MAREEQCKHFFGDTEKAMGFSQAVRADNVLYISGVLAVNESLEVTGPGDMAAQVKQVYATLSRILADNGATFKDVVKETVFATDLPALGGALAARQAAFDEAGAYVPASTMVQVSGLFLPDAMIEVEVIAHL